MSLHCTTKEHEKRDRHGLPVLTRQYEPLPPGIDIQYWSRWFPNPQGLRKLNLVRLRLEPGKENR